MDPKVSAIIPTGDREPFLGDLLHSVMHQDVPLEVLVVDAALPRGVTYNKQVVDLVRANHPEAPPLRFLEQLYGRKGTAMNMGADAARADVLLFLDADVLLPGGIVQDALALLSAFDIVSSKRIHEVLGWNVLAEPFLPRIRFPGPWFCMMTRDTFRALHGFIDHPVEDVDFWLRTRELAVGYTEMRVRLRRRVRKEFKKAFHLIRALARKT